MNFGLSANHIRAFVAQSIMVDEPQLVNCITWFGKQPCGTWASSNATFKRGVIRPIAAAFLVQCSLPLRTSSLRGP